MSLPQSDAFATNAFIAGGGVTVAITGVRTLAHSVQTLSVYSSASPKDNNGLQWSFISGTEPKRHITRIRLGPGAMLAGTVTVPVLTSILLVAEAQTASPTSAKSPSLL